jgi:hypothetical protein
MQNQNTNNGILNVAKAAQTGLIAPPSGYFSEGLVSEFMPQYYGLVKAGLVYSLAVAGITPAAFVGGAAGTPIFGIYNPLNSGKDFVLLQSRLAVRTTGTAAVATDFNLWAANQGGTSPSGSQTQPRNVYNQNLSGSASYSMVNTVNTGAVASALLQPSFSVGLTAATAVTDVTLLTDDLKGLVVLSPGSYLAFGQSVATTAGSFDAALTWAELPV